MKTLIFTLIYLLLLVSSSREHSSQLFGEDINNENLTYIHVFCHSHNDAGWLWTPEEYYQGQNGWGACVKCILDRLPKYLPANPDRKFMYVEMSFFTHWWNQQNNETKAIMRDLIKSKQLELTQAGWVMNDEACAYYEDIIDHMTLGLQWVAKEFNQFPNVGWSIDPFGHSRSQAKILRELGFDGFFIERIDRQDFDDRLYKKGMEMLWRTDDDALDDEGSDALFTHVNYYNYFFKPLGNRQIFGSKNDYSNAENAMKYWRNESNFYRTKHLIHHVGGDFVWGYGEEMPSLFDGIEGAIQYFNKEHPEHNIRVAYSTPRLYLETIFNETKEKKESLNFPQKFDDFFPYADAHVAYWSGFFTTRAAFKHLIREGGRRLQAWKNLWSKLLLTKFPTANFEEVDKTIFELEDIMGVLQHHDAVTGTAKQRVTDWYIKELQEKLIKADNVFFDQLKQLYRKKEDDSVVTGDYFECHNRHPTQVCIDLAKETDRSLLLTVYNPGPAMKRVVTVKLPNWRSAEVRDEHGELIESDFVCGTTEMSKCLLYFMADFGTLEIKSFMIHADMADESVLKVNSLTNSHKTLELKWSNDVSLKFNPNTHQFKYRECTSKKPVKCIDNKFDINYRCYISHTDPKYVSAPGNWENGLNAHMDGAYLLRTDLDDQPYTGEIVKMSYFKGRIVSEIMIDREAMTTRVRIFHQLPELGIEIESYVKPIDLSDNKGKNVIMKIRNENIQNARTFYTDQNGLTMQQRVFGSRFTWTPHHIEHINISANYYPVNSAIKVADLYTQDTMTLMVDRSEGGSSQKNGEIEVMLHRRHVSDDERGVEEILDEKEPDGSPLKVRITHRLLFSNPNLKLNSTQRLVQHLIDSPLVVLMSQPSFKDFNEIIRPMGCSEKMLKYQQERLSKQHLKIFIRPTSKDEFVLRIQNMNETSEVSTVFLHRINGMSFSPLLDEMLTCMSQQSVDILMVDETTLAGTQRKEDVMKRRMDWLKHEEKSDETVHTKDLSVLHFKPLEIRTFRVKTHGLFENWAEYSRISPEAAGVQVKEKRSLPVKSHDHSLTGICDKEFLTVAGGKTMGVMMTLLLAIFIALMI